MHGYLRTLQLRRMCAVDSTAKGGMRLQLFAAGDGAENGSTAGVAETVAGEAETETEAPASEKMLSQSEVNRIVQETIAKERARAKKQADEARTEAEKLAKMTEQQRMQHEADKRMAELTKRETELNRRELRATAAETLASKNLPAALLDILDYSDADACNRAIDAAEAAWSRAVQAGVEERLKGRPPRTGGIAAPQSGVEAEFLRLNPNLKI